MLSTAYAGVDRQSDPAPRTSSGRIQKRELPEGEQLLTQRVQLALRNAGHPALRELEIEVADGVIFLCGSVTSFYQKQLAQVVVQRVNGVRGVVNGLEVICQRP